MLHHAEVQLVIAEKPSVARDLARALGVRPQGSGCFVGEQHVITWCVGHLVELDEPGAYDPRWKSWRLDTLPMLPQEFMLRPAKHGADQLHKVASLLRDRRFASVVNACDAGREGELIFRYVVQYAGHAPPAQRLWISSMTDEAIRRGFAALRPGAHYDHLADAARSRSEADWLVGLNATRAVTVMQRGAGGDALYSIGRVQTPTLAMLVQREQAIRAFVPRDYWELEGRFTTEKGDHFTGKWTRGKLTQLGSAAVAEQVVERCAAHGKGADPAGPQVESVQGKAVREPPPQLFDLTSLQRTANRRFGFSAQRTLDLAQALYEKHKLLTYPRTDSRHLSTDVAGELPGVFAQLARVPEYADFAAPLVAETPRPNRRIVDDAKVSDHHAIIPTGKPIQLGALDADERKLVDLVVRRFLGAFWPDAEFAETEVIVRVGGAGRFADAPVPVVGKDDEGKPLPLAEAPPPPDWFVARGRVRLVAGWQVVAGLSVEEAVRGAGGGKDKEDPPAVLPPLAEGQPLSGAFAAKAKKTRPPPRYTEATLLSAMESAGKTLTDEELRAAMKDTGLGTPATRASIIETLLKRGYADREGKAIVATPTGCALIETLPVASLASPELTGTWEARLARIARGEDSRPSFMADIAAYVRETIEAIRRAPGGGVVPPAAQAARPAAPRSSGAKAASARPAARADSGAAAPRGAVARAASRAAAPRGAAARPAPAAAPVGAPGAPTCPRCRRGTMVRGKRGWGCSRWREGCAFVVWFETAGVTLSDAQLRELVVRGATRAGAGVLRLDVAGEGGARYEPA